MLWTALLVAVGGFCLILAGLIPALRICHKKKGKIPVPAGIQWTGYVTVGGIEQYLQIRGRNREAPVILVLHGGPGNPMAAYSYEWQAPLEERYTVVHWDQRGCGNTYYRAPQAQVPTLERLMDDLDELVNWLCRTFQQEKIVLLGHSWGTFLGGHYVLEHPERIKAWVAVGQMVDFRDSELCSTREAIRLARVAGRARDADWMEGKLGWLRVLRRLDQAAASKLLRLRTHKERYLPAQYSNRMGILRLGSPDMTWSDLRWICRFDRLIQMNLALYDALLTPGRSSMYDVSMRYEVPVLMLTGENDWTTPWRMARDYFQQIAAPSREFLTIEGAGHLPFLDRPEEFTALLLDRLERI